MPQLVRLPILLVQPHQLLLLFLSALTGLNSQASRDNISELKVIAFVRLLFELFQLAGAAHPRFAQFPANVAPISSFVM
jgi:hypothetical protein